MWLGFRVPNGSERGRGSSRSSERSTRRFDADDVGLRCKAADARAGARRRSPSPGLYPHRSSSSGNGAQPVERRPATPSSPSMPSTPPYDVEMQISSRKSMGGRSAEGLWPSMRSLSVSFQSDSISIPFVKLDKPATNAASDHALRSSANIARKVTTPERKRTPLRGKNAQDQSENSKPVENSSFRGAEQHMWPGRAGGKLPGSSLTKTLDLTDIRASSPTLPRNRISPNRRIPPSSGGALPNSVRESTKLTCMDSSVEKTSKPVENSSFRRAEQHVWPSRAGGKLLGLPLTKSLDLTDGLIRAPSPTLPRNRISPSKRIPALDARGKGASSNSVRESTKLTCMDTSVEKTSSRVHVSSKFVSPVPGVALNLSERAASMTTKPTRSQSAPRIRESSPQRGSPLSYSTRGLQSPLRTRPSTPSSPVVCSRSNGEPSSFFSLIADSRNWKKTGHAENVHQLRILHNRHLQWRFVNAHSASVSAVQKSMLENILYTVWHKTSKLRDSLTMRRINLQQLRQEMKVKSILKGQITLLDKWSMEERDHVNCLSGALEALEADTIHLPVGGGAGADIQTVKVAISSAVDIMQAMGPCIYSILSRVERMSWLVSQLARVAVQERTLLNECKNLLASAAALKVEESSFRVHLIQLLQSSMMH